MDPPPTYADVQEKQGHGGYHQVAQQPPPQMFQPTPAANPGEIYMSEISALKLNGMYYCSDANTHMLVELAKRDGFSNIPTTFNDVFETKGWHPTVWRTSTSGKQRTSKTEAIPPRFASDGSPFGPDPQISRCNTCNKDVRTTIKYEEGRLATCCYVWSSLCICFVLPIVGYCMPCCCESTFQDEIHSCPECQNPIGRQYKEC